MLIDLNQNPSQRSRGTEEYHSEEFITYFSVIFLCASVSLWLPLAIDTEEFC